MPCCISFSNILAAWGFESPEALVKPGVSNIIFKNRKSWILTALLVLKISAMVECFISSYRLTTFFALMLLASACFLTVKGKYSSKPAITVKKRVDMVMVDFEFF